MTDRWSATKLGYPNCTRAPSALYFCLWNFRPPGCGFLWPHKVWKLGEVGHLEMIGKTWPIPSSKHRLLIYRPKFVFGPKKCWNTMFGVGLQKSGTNPKEEKTRRGEGWNHKESYCDSLKFDSRIHLHISLHVLQRVTWILAAITRPTELHPGGLCLKAGFPTSKIEKKCSKTQKCPKSLGPNGKFWNFDPFPPVITSLSRPWASVPKKKHMPRTLGSGLCCHQTWQSEIPERNRGYSRYYSHLWENHEGFSMAIFDERVLLMTVRIGWDWQVKQQKCASFWRNIDIAKLHHDAWSILGAACVSVVQLRSRNRSLTFSER